MAAGVGTRIWPEIYKRVQADYKEGYVCTAMRMNEHTRQRISDELGNTFGKPSMRRTGNNRDVLLIVTDMGNILVKIDKSMPDDKVILQTDASWRKYNGPVEVEVIRNE